MESWEPENQRYKTSWPGGHHLVSMGIHCANAVLLFLALRLMTGTLWPSFVVAALFAVHPLRAESVAWGAERKDVLCGLFWMASMLAYAFYARRRPLRQSSPPEMAATLAIYSLTTLLFAMALLAKSMAVTLPCVFLLLDVWPLNRWRNVLWPPGEPESGPDLVAAVGLLAEKIPWFGLVIYDCMQTVVGQDKGVALNSWEGLPLAPRLLNALMDRQLYRSDVLACRNGPVLSPSAHAEKRLGRLDRDELSRGDHRRDHPRRRDVGRPLVLAEGISGRRLVLVLGALMPVIGILQVGTQSLADRYTYLPMIGVYLIVAWLLKEVADRWPKRGSPWRPLRSLVFTTLSAISFQQVSYWIDSYTLFEHAAQVTDNNWFAYNHIGIAYDKDAKAMSTLDPPIADALFDHLTRHFQGPPKIHEDGQKPSPTYDSPEDYRTAVKKLDRGQKQELLFDYSADNFKAAIDIKPDYDFGNNNLGVYFAHPGPSQDLVKAERYFKGALMSNQRYADAYNNLGIVLAGQGKLDEAIACHKAGLSIFNHRASDHNNLCRVYVKKYVQETQKNQPALAKADLENALAEHRLSVQCDPNFLPAWINGTEIYIKQGALDEAEKCVRRMIEIDAKSPSQTTYQAEGMLAEYYLGKKRFDKALMWLNQMLEINKSAPDIYTARGFAYVQGDLAQALKNLDQNRDALKRALEDFEQALRINPQFPGAGESSRNQGPTCRSAEVTCRAARPEATASPASAR